MSRERFKYFKYEIALGAEIPIPKPKLDVFPNHQNSVQQFLFTVGKEHVGVLGKREGRWGFGGEYKDKVKLHTRSDITEILDFVEELGIIVAAPGEGGEIVQGEEGFTPYKLSDHYIEKFAKFTS